MPNLELPSIIYMPSYISALKAGYIMGSGEAKTKEEISKIQENSQDFIDDYFKPKPPTRINEYGEEITRVPQTKFWYVDNETFIGEIAVRHELNDYLLNRGGHIGYGVRPDMKGQNHGTGMLNLALDFCRNTLFLDKVLITTDDTNISSIRVIEKNKGMLEDIRIDKLTNTPFRRYWITL